MRWTAAAVGIAFALVTGCGDDDRRIMPSFPDGGPVDANGADTSVRPLPDAGPAANVLIYAHSRDVLYTFSPATLTVTPIGNFTLPTGAQADRMLDLAVDAAGEVFTCSETELFRVDPETAGVTVVGAFDLPDREYLYALTFLAAGVLDPTEVLVGATNEGVYYRVSPTNARTQHLGSYPDGWLSSGDIVSVEELGTFATVKRADFPSDVLVQMFFAADGTSTATIVGPVHDGARDFSRLFGLGFWGTAMYGFSADGELVEIDRVTGAGRLVTTSTMTTEFWGAGVTTQAPILF